MTDDLSVAFERLRTSTERLNSICDAAANTIRNTETYLEDLHVGVAASVHVFSIWEDEDGRERTEVSLEYLRHDTKKFRIVVEFAEYFESSCVEREVKTWAECSRDDKLRTFEKLPELVVEIARKVDERVLKAERTITEVEAQIPLPKKAKGGTK